MNESVEIPKPNLDIGSLVKKTQGRYSKKQAGLANDLTTGDGIVLSENPSDYVLSKEVSYWYPLTGIKGIPYGRIVQIAGRPDSGKSSSAMFFMKAAQQAGTLVILWDAEKKFSSKRYRDIGGDPSSLLVTRSKNISEGSKQVCWYVKEAKEQNPDIKVFIVWDSVGATLNSSEDDEDKEDFSKQPGVTAKEVSQSIRKINKLIERYRKVDTGEETIALLCVNQTYANIGSVGQKEKGGQELEYLSSIILQLTRKSDLLRTVKGNKKKYGILTRAKVRKNHLFDGEDCIAELNLIISSDGVKLEKEVAGYEELEVEDD